MKHKLPILLLSLVVLWPLSAGAAKADDDWMELPGTSIIGNQELPVGLDIVPWRPAEPGAIKEGPTQLLDEPLRPIDPEVFRRELHIYETSRSQTAQ